MTSARRGARSLGAAALVAATLVAAHVRAQPVPVPVPAPAPAPAPSRAAGRGVVVVALGTGSLDAARALAREVYGDATLRPPIDEAAAQALTGGVLPDGADPRARDLAALRAALDPDPANPATRRALESVAAELGAAAALAVITPADGPARARLIRAGAADQSGVEIVASPTSGAAPGTAPTWPDAVRTLLALLPPPAAHSAPPPPPPRGPGAAAPSRSGTAAQPAAGTEPAAPGTDPPAPGTEPADTREFYERPWFWAALGAFAAAGLTALVVSQTAGPDEPSDTVRFRATIPETTVLIPWIP